MPGSFNTGLMLDAETAARMLRLAKSRRRSPHWVMRDAVEQYLAREEARERAWQDAQAAWDIFQADGRHVTGDEADAWLAKLEAGEAADPPECHG